MSVEKPQDSDVFFNPKHRRLLGIAILAKYLARVALVVYFFLSFAQILEFQDAANFQAAILNEPARALQSLLVFYPLDAARLGIEMAGILLKGVVYYVVLKGISLGLNMIVETDVNYRMARQEEGKNE